MRKGKTQNNMECGEGQQMGLRNYNISPAKQRLFFVFLSTLPSTLLSRNSCSLWQNKPSADAGIILVEWEMREDVATQI